MKPGKIEGTHELHVLLKFRCPPDVPPEKVAAMVSQGGITVALGLLQFALGSEANIVKVEPTPRLV